MGTFKFSLTIILLAVLQNVFVQAQDKPIKVNGFDIKVQTLSKGKYCEFFDQEDIVEIGSVLYNTQTGKVVGFLNDDTTTYNIPPELVSRWLSVDRMAEKYYSISPYVYCKDNPIKFIDPNGDSLKVNDISQNNTAITKMDQMIDKKTNGYYKRTVDENGNSVLTSSGKNDPDNPMSKEGQSFVDQFNSVANSSDMTTVNVTDNDKNILIVDPKNATIDIGDLKTIDDKNLPLKSGTGMMMHEIVEQQGIQNGGTFGVELWHQNGIRAENVIDGSIRTNYYEGKTPTGAHVSVIEVRGNDGNIHRIYIFPNTNNIQNAVEK
jgi:RHS repeat-associated protein